MIYQHIGQFISEEIFRPKKLSITKAAELLAISRPNLSKVINGHAALSEDVAIKIEKTFGIEAKMLLDMQMQYDLTQKKATMNNQPMQAYVQPFLNFKANDIEDYFTKYIDARIRLSVFLRFLIHSTTPEIVEINFPGYDNAQRAGDDGLLKSNSTTPWVPLGTSYWEFGITEDIRKKANDDYIKSTKAKKKEERQNTTFIFVTPKPWPSKNAWIEAKRKEKQWKDVRAYDASDLEQWLEQSIPAQTLFAELVGKTAKGVKTLDRCWKEWIDVSKPTLEPILFETAITVWQQTILDFIEDATKDTLSITADSHEEALAFLSQVFEDPKLCKEKGKILVFTERDEFTQLSAGNVVFIPVVYDRDIERELGTHKRIVIYPRNMPGFQPDVTLEPIDYILFDKALKKMGKNRDEI